MDLLSDLWALFGPPDAPGVVWCAAGVVLPLAGVVPLLIAVVGEWLTGG